jgi:NDP-sugar pyrophosphorylase family protein
VPAASDFFDLSAFAHARLLLGAPHVWDALSALEAYLRDRLSPDPTLPDPGGIREGAVLIHPESIYVGEGTIVESGATIVGPAFLGRNCEVRQGAYLRGVVLTGDGCVVGHCTEVKNAIMLDGSHAAHFAYVGDSILGNRVILGAGTKLSNLSLFAERDPATGKRPTIRITIEGTDLDTGLSKMGCILGDDCRTGCNVVTSPGCLIGRRTVVYGGVSLPKGCYPPGRIIKLRQQLEIVERR